MSQSNTLSERRAVLFADHEPPPDLPELTYAAQGCVMGHWRAVGVVVWATQAIEPHVQEMAKLADVIGRTHLRGSNVTLAINRAPLPTYDARRGIHELTRRYEKTIVCSATLIEGGGFWSSAVRSLVTSLHLIGRWSFELKTFSDIDSLAAWVAPIHARGTGIAVEPEELAGALAWIVRQPAIRDLCDRR